jgi:hypothetical protein
MGEDWWQDTQHNDTQHNTAQRALYVTLRINDTQHNNTIIMLSVIMLSVIMLSVVMLSVVVPWSFASNVREKEKRASLRKDEIDNLLKHSTSSNLLSLRQVIM